MYKDIDDVKRVIDLGKPESVIEIFWKSYQEGLQYEEWLEEMKTAYDVLWPETEEVKVSESTLNEDTGTYEGSATFIQKTIDYSENPDWLSFEDWLQERETVLVDVTTLDEEMNEVTIQVEQKGELIRQFEFDESSVNSLDSFPEFKSHKNREYLEYLSLTDWYVSRKQETGVDIPPEVSKFRALARESINKRD